MQAWLCNRNRTELIVLTTIVLIAASLRLLGIQQGLPYVLYPDEAVLVNHAMAFGTGDLNPHYFIYPSLYMYVLFLIYGVGYVAGHALGIFSSTEDFARLLFTNATPFYLSGRLIAASCGTITVGLVFLLAQRCYSTRVGLAAAAFLAVSEQHVSFSHFVKTHAVAGMFVALTFMAAVSIYREGSRKSYLLAGLCSGLGISTIYHVVFVNVSIVVAHVLRWREKRKDAPASLAHPWLFASLALSVIAFFAGTPYALLDWRNFSGDLQSTGRVFLSGGFWERDTLFPLTSLVRTMGTPIGAIALAGLAYALLLRRRPSDLLLGSQPLFLALFLMLFRAKEPHHMLIAFPALAILGASLVVDIVERVFATDRWRGFATGVVVSGLIAAPAVKSFQQSYELSLPDTRIAAKAWVEDNLPSGSRIVMDSGKYYLGSFGPPLLLSQWSLEQLIARGESVTGANLADREGTRRLGYSGESEYFRRQIAAVKDLQTYDVVQILHDIGSSKADVSSIGEYKAAGMQYAIVSSYAWEGYAPGSENVVRHPSKAARYWDFYQGLARDAILLKEFSPSDRTYGPTLRVYRLR